MLSWKKWMLPSIFSLMVPALFLSISILYSQNACAEEWKPCTQKYTIMDALTEIIFAETETGENEREITPPQRTPELPSAVSLCQTNKSSSLSPVHNCQYGDCKRTN